MKKELFEKDICQTCENMPLGAHIPFRSIENGRYVIACCKLYSWLVINDEI